MIKNRISIPCNPANYRSIQTRNLSNIKYIVIHYTANNGDTAKGNGEYFNRTNYRAQGKSPASAHYFVDETTVCQSVPEQYEAYQCGTTGTYKHKTCRNPNSIGVEMVSRKDSKGQYYIKDEVIENTVIFVRELMDKYNIPISNIVRHYDVTGKSCPEPFVRNENLWKDFLKRLEEENVEVKTTNIKTPSGVKQVDCINYKDTNYVKLRDISKIAPITISFSNSTISAVPTEETKTIKINNEKEKVDSVTLFDTNYVKLRSIASTLGYDVDFNNGEIVLKKK